MNTSAHPGTELSPPTGQSIEQLFGESQVTTSLIYAFPAKLVGCFRAAEDDAAPSLLDQKSIDRELALSNLVNFRNQVAFRQHAPAEATSIVNYRFLGDAPSPITAEYLRLAGSKQPVKAAEEFNAVAEPHFRHVQAYCGWLLQQEAYWHDLKVVINLFSDDFTDNLLPKQVFGAPEGADLVEEPRPSTIAFRSFCEKWRLQGMATLDLPVVMEPQITSTSIYTPNSHPASVTPFLPDIFPMDSKGPLATSLDNARIGIEAPHLEGWKALIAISSRQKKKVHHYARQFCLQHYWRVLLQRYPQQTRKRKSDIEEAFGRYFGVDATTIRSDGQKMANLIDRNLSTFL